LLGGLTTDEIARAFLVPEPTIAQRIVPAKRTLSDAHVPFEVPRGDDLAARLSSVLEVVYLIFNEGYSLTNYQLLPAVRGDMLAKLGRHDEARVEFERAASLTRNVRERDLLLARAAGNI
jgi:predicted RNA polymerase sigma factor